MRSKRTWLTMVVIVGLGAAIAIVTIGLGNDEASSAEATTTTEVNTASVVQTDLAEEITFDGTVGLLDAEPVTAPVAGTLTERVSSSTIVGAGDVAYEIDGVSVPVIVDDGVLYRDLQLGESPRSVPAQTNGVVTRPAAVGESLEQGDVAYYVDGEPAVVLYGDSSFSRQVAVPESTASATTFASDLQAEQTRAGLVEAIAEAEQTRDDYRADLPSNDLLNAIDELTRLEQAGAESHEVSAANQRVAAAQKADNDGLVANDEAVESAIVELREFEEVQAATRRDQAAADANSVVDNLTGNDIRQLEQALVELGYDADGRMTVDGEYTSATAEAVRAWQSDSGAQVTGEVRPEHVVFLPGPSTVIDIVEDGTTVPAGTPIVTFSGGATIEGDDVLLLQNAINAASVEGVELEPTGVYDEDTLAAVLLWQEATGQDTDGVVSPTDVLVLSEPSLVSETHADPGDRLQVGAALLSFTSTERFVTVEVPAEDQSVLKVGDDVIVELPDFSETPGVVTEVSTTATELLDGTTIFEATVELDDPSVAADLDEAPVEIIAIESEIVGATAVPVTALVALAEGGYAVEVVSDAGSRLVRVDPGFFADGLVEIRSGDISAGDLVTVP